jgi:hypothetical protein
MTTLEHPLGTIVVLEYPNGRTVEATLPDIVSLGEEFGMHGRRWRVVGRLQTRRPRTDEPTRILCRSLGLTIIGVIDDPRD